MAGYFWKLFQKFLKILPLVPDRHGGNVNSPSIGSQKRRPKYNLSTKVLYDPLNREASQRAKNLRSSKNFIYFFVYPHKAPSLNSHGREHFSTDALKNLLFFCYRRIRWTRPSHLVATKTAKVWCLNRKFHKVFIYPSLPPTLSIGRQVIARKVYTSAKTSPNLLRHKKSRETCISAHPAGISHDR